ncbi:hypothetical protein NPX13_g180 [Xylaria arbuscula]|uniref:Uncharacterized protein n=1 Tax=Xylaria arbuscula TaxID=114810 RepID=A0A9W8NP74_9PEZI|nr:hypothetical protein NPX13_g180 [Xylaria arbuscula]
MAMLPCALKFVRKDRDRIVLTEHPDRIPPQDLYPWLEQKFGESHVRVSLRRELYVIYIDRKVVNIAEFCPDTSEDTDTEEIQQKLGRELIPDLERIQQDIEDAIEVLKKARMRSMGIKG